MIFFPQRYLLNSVIVILFIVSCRPASTRHSGVGARSFSKWNCSDVGFVWFVLRTCLLLVCCSPIHVRLQPIVQRIKKTGKMSKKEARFRIWFTFSSAPARLFWRSCRQCFGSAPWPSSFEVGGYLSRIPICRFACRGGGFGLSYVFGGTYVRSCRWIQQLCRFFWQVDLECVIPCIRLAVCVASNSKQAHLGLMVRNPLLWR